MAEKTELEDLKELKQISKDRAAENKLAKEDRRQTQLDEASGNTLTFAIAKLGQTIEASSSREKIQAGALSGVGKTTGLATGLAAAATGGSPLATLLTAGAGSALKGGVEKGFGFLNEKKKRFDEQKLLKEEEARQIEQHRMDIEQVARANDLTFEQAEFLALEKKKFDEEEKRKQKLADLQERIFGDLERVISADASVRGGVIKDKETGKFKKLDDFRSAVKAEEERQEKKPGVGGIVPVVGKKEQSKKGFIGSIIGILGTMMSSLGPLLLGALGVVAAGGLYKFLVGKDGKGFLESTLNFLGLDKGVGVDLAKQMDNLVKTVDENDLANEAKVAIVGSKMIAPAVAKVVPKVIAKIAPKAAVTGLEAVAKAGAKVTELTAPKAVKTGAEVAGAVAPKLGEKIVKGAGAAGLTVTKALAKASAKLATKAITKLVPGLGIGLDLASMWERGSEGDITGAVIDGLAALTFFLPPLSLGFSALNITRDLKKAGIEPKQVSDEVKRGADLGDFMVGTVKTGRDLNEDSAALSVAKDKPMTVAPVINQVDAASSSISVQQGDQINMAPGSASNESSFSRSQGMAFGVGA